MSLLVIGANGLVGSSLVRNAAQRGRSVTGTYHAREPDFDVELVQVDLTDERRTRDLVREVDPTAVVNCAAVTNVDRCEAEPDHARLVNGVAPGRLAAACADLEIPFVQLSTDYVFDGRKQDPYDEADEPNPLQMYGRTKLLGERQTMDVHPDALICRLSFVYGRHGGTDELVGFPAWVKKRCEAGETVPLFTDQVVTPTRAGYAAETVLSLLDADCGGVFHVASSDCVTPYEFGRSIATRIRNGTTDVLERSSMAAVTRDAERPRFTCLATDALQSIRGEAAPRLEADLDAVLRRGEG